MAFVVGIDSGGTFTDCMAVEKGEGGMVRTTTKAKVVTTPYDLSECFAEVLASVAENRGLGLPDFLSKCESIRYSQTIATNALITRTGTKLGLIVTLGHQDDLYGGGTGLASRLLASGMVAGVREGVDAGGKLSLPLDVEEGKRAVDILIDKGARAIAVALKNSFFNPANESVFREIIKQEYPPQYLGRVPVFLSHEVAAVRDDGVRLTTTVVDSYVHGLMATYLYKAEDFLRANGYRRPLQLVNSDGMLSTIPWTRATSAIGSGPAAGVIGAYLLGNGRHGLQEALTLDVGGTSLDISLVRGTPVPTYYTSLEGSTVFQAMIDVSSVAIGGGSLAKVSEGKIAVGPESAGSSPGPACFARGGEAPTPTDANLLLGYLDPENFLGGRLKLDKKAAEEAVATVAGPLRMSVKDACLAIKRETDEKIIAAIGKLLAGRRPDRRISAYCYGGAGPLHASAVLTALPQVEKMMVTPFSSEFSAMGCCMLDAGHHYYKEVSLDGSSALSSSIEALEQRAAKDIVGEGFAIGEAKLRASLYAEEGRSIVREWAGELGQLKDLQELQGLSRGGLFVLAVRWTVPSAKPSFPEAGPDTEDATNSIRERARPVSWDGGEPTPTDVYEMSRLSAGNRVNGPAIIEAEDTTVTVQKGLTVSVTRFGDLMMERRSPSAPARRE